MSGPPNSQPQLPRTPYESSRDKIISACDELLKLVVADGLAGHNEISQNVNSIKACFSDGNSQTEKHSKILELKTLIEQQLSGELNNAENDNKNYNNSVKATGLVLQKIAKIKEELKFIAIIETNIAGVLPLKRESQSNLEEEVPPSLAAAAIPTTSHTNNALQQLEVSKREVDQLNLELTLLKLQLAEEQQQNKQLNADNQRLTETNSSLLNDKQTISLSLQEKITANEVLSTTVATTESKNLELGDEKKVLKAQLSEIQTNQSTNNDTISQLQREISQLTAASSVSGKQLLATEEAIARFNLQHERETISLKAMLQASQELLSKQTEQLQRTATDNEQLQAQREDDKRRIAALAEKLASSSKKNDALEAKRAGLQQISDQKTQTIPADDQKSIIEELTKANVALTEQLSQSQAQHRSEIEAAKNSNSATASIMRLTERSQQELTEKNTALQAQLDGLAKENAALQAQLDGLTDENSVLRENLRDTKEEVGLLETKSNAHLEEAMARLAEIQKLKEQISNIAAAEQLATSSSANMADRIRELEQREKVLAAKSKPKPESPPSITLVTPVSPILETKPTNSPITETPTPTPTPSSILDNIAQELETVTPTVSGGGRVVNIEQIQKEGGKETDRPYFDVKNTQQIKLGEEANNPLKTLFDAGTLQFSNQEKPNKITFSNESMDPSDLQAMVAILQATSKDNKEPTLNNVEVILTGKDEDLIQVLQQFHAKLAAAVQGNDDEKICAIKIQDKGGHSEELTYLIKLHNAAANIIHNNTEEGLTADKKNNILKEIKALQEKATQLLASNPTDHRSHHPTLS